MELEALVEHLIHPRLLERRVAVHLVGVGGNGAQMAACLARLDIAMRALGHPYGLHVTAFDADRVSEANVGRQLYSAADIGRHKALVTIHRLNQFYGLDWDAHPMRYEEHVNGQRYWAGTDLLISCVDSRSARGVLHRIAWRDTSRYRYWLDRRPYTFNQGTGDKVYTRDPSYEQRLRDAESYMKEQCNTP